MTILRNWLNTHKFQVHALAFGLMMVTPVTMFFAAQGGAVVWIWFFLALFVAGNLLALSVP
jgi:uncharacterized membrane protein